MTQNPFRYGEAVLGEYFAGQYRERELLVSELTAGHNVLLTGPTRYGKTSLARKVMSDFERRGVMTVYIDLERAYSPLRLIEIYLAELLRAAFRQTKELRTFVQDLKPELKQNLLLKIENNDELILDLNDESDLEMIAGVMLDLSQHTVDYKKRPCVVCFDEITQGGNLSSGLRQRILEVAKTHQGVGYLLVSLTPLPELNSEQFLHVPLGKIEERYLKAYIKTRFENTGFRITEDSIDEIIATTEGHPHFTQMICRKLWNQWTGGKTISNKDIARAVESILETQSEFYAELWHDLSLHQKNLLLAVCKGGGQKVFSQDYVSQHGLGSFSTVQKSLNRLLARHVLERREESYFIRDIFFQRWLARRIV